MNFNGGELLERAVRSALGSQWPGEIDVVVVDNASTDDSVESVETLPGVTVLRQKTNDGFAASNYGFADLVGGELESFDGGRTENDDPTVASLRSDTPRLIELEEPGVVALLNPDAMVRSDTFRLLAAPLNADQRVGACSPMIVFDRPFIELAVTGEELVIDALDAGGVDIGARCHGIDGAERLPGADAPVWLCPAGSTLRLPVANLSERVMVGIRSGNGSLGGHDVKGPTEIRIDPARKRSHRVIQNAGVQIDARGTGVSRGFGETVGTNLGAPAPLWCGAAVAFHPDYLREVGGFDHDYFLYYEDVDLGLRGQAAGWKTEHVPEAVVEHRHSDRTVQGTELVEVLQHRNRLLTMVRHNSLPSVAVGYARAALTPVSLGVSAIRNPSQRAERLRLAKWRAKALKDAVTGIPAARKARSTSD